MAVYTPVLLKPPAGLAVSPAATIYTPSGSTVGVIRTIQFSAAATGHAVTMSIGADAAGTRIFSAMPLVANVPSIFNGWWVVPNGTNVQAFADAGSNAVVVMLSGYEYG